MTQRQSTRAAGGITLLAVLAFTLVCTAVQVLRTDLDWIRVPLSFYLIGPHAAWVRGAYLLLGLGLAVFGLGWYRALAPRARSFVPALLFVVAGVALGVTAFATTNTWAQPATLHGFVHGVAAQTTFLCVTVGMLMLGWRLRRDPTWRALHLPAFAGAAACFAALWLQGLWRHAPRGLTQKALILALLAWLAGMAWVLYKNKHEEYRLFY